MRIERMTVSGLFGRFNHDLRFRAEEPIAIMIGPNGFGKTMILRMVNGLFNQAPSALARLPLNEFVVLFDNGSAVKVRRRLAESPGSEPRPLVEMEFVSPSGESLVFTPGPSDLENVNFPLEMLEEWIPTLTRTRIDRWRDIRTAEELTLEDVMVRFANNLPPGVGTQAGGKSPIPAWLAEIRQAIPVRLIDTERLTGISPDILRGSRSVRQRMAGQGRTVRMYSQDLAERIQRKFTEYGSLAQSLDRTFPARLVEEEPRSDWQMEGLRHDLIELESKRRKLVEAGLLGKDAADWGVGVPVLETVDDSKRGVLAVYARDARKKLSVFDDLYARVETFGRISNARFLHKQVTIGSDGFRVRASDGSNLELEMLSSGEQHELVLLYELLFRTPENSLILIDEPELSLHVAWQEQFLNDLEEIAKLSHFRALLATHSPQIIGDRWDLTIELRGPNGG